MQKVDYLLIGPAYPYRGGIAQTQNEFALSLIKLGKIVHLITFKKLYPKFLFPGKSQYSSEVRPNILKISRIIHSYNPFNWIKTAKKINSINPDVVIFRYYTPLLAFCYFGIINALNKKIKKVALIDNWIHHEPRFYDKILNTLFSKKIDSFITLSDNVAQQIKKQINSNIFSGFHPISNNLPKKISRLKARKEIGWDVDAQIVLFYGLIRPYKGLENLLKAFSKLPLKLSNVKLAIIGEFYEPISKYQKIIKEFELEEKIYLVPGYSNETSTQLYFSSADLTALTYRSATQSGVIPIAYHYNTPILVTNLLGLKTPIAKDNTGMICSQDPKDISIKLTEMLNKDRNNIFITNIEKSKKNYSWSLYSKLVIKFIDKTN